MPIGTSEHIEPEIWISPKPRFDTRVLRGVADHRGRQAGAGLGVVGSCRRTTHSPGSWSAHVRVSDQRRQKAGRAGDVELGAVAVDSHPLVGERRAGWHDRRGRRCRQSSAVRVLPTRAVPRIAQSATPASPPTSVRCTLVAVTPSAVTPSGSVPKLSDETLVVLVDAVGGGDQGERRPTSAPRRASHRRATLCSPPM